MEPDEALAPGWLPKKADANQSTEREEESVCGVVALQENDGEFKSRENSATFFPLNPPFSLAYAAAIPSSLCFQSYSCHMHTHKDTHVIRQALQTTTVAWIIMHAVSFGWG